MGMRSLGVLITCAGVLLNLTAAYALPKRIIILRHAEKMNPGGLCQLGKNRAQALATTYLGFGAQNSADLFPPNSVVSPNYPAPNYPAAFYANTPHAYSTIEPAFQTWNNVYKDIKLYGPLQGEGDLDEWSRMFAEAVLKNYDGKIVVMTWEHSRIANEEKVGDSTLYTLLGLSNYKGTVPIDLKNWCGSNYDYFWIVEYNPEDKYNGKPPTPTNITVKMQELTGLPQNKWGTKEKESDWSRECSDTPNPACP